MTVPARSLRRSFFLAIDPASLFGHAVLLALHKQMFRDVNISTPEVSASAKRVVLHFKVLNRTKLLEQAHHRVGADKTFVVKQDQEENASPGLAVSLATVPTPWICCCSRTFANQLEFLTPC